MLLGFSYRFDFLFLQESHFDKNEGQRTIKDDHQILKISASLSDKLATPTRSRDAGSFKVFHSTGDYYYDNNDDIFDDDDDDDDGDDDDDNNACTVLFFPGHPVNGSQA